MNEYQRNYKRTEKGLRNRRKGKKKYYAKTAFKSKNEPFTLTEDKLILQHKYTDTELSDIINRSVMSIQIRRCRLKKEMAKNE